MGKVIAKKIKGMSWTARIGLTMILTLLVSVFMYEGWYKPRQSQASISQQQAWTNVYHSATVPGASAASFAVTAGTNRMLVVAITSSMTSANSQTMTSVSYGGQAMTFVAGDAATSSRSHTYLYYLKDNAVMDGTAKTLAVSMSASNSLVHDVYYAVYSGVDQSATPLSDNRNSNNSSGSTTAAFGTALTVKANDQAVVVYNAMNSSSTTIPTVAVPTNFTLAATMTWNTNNGNTSKVVYRNVPVSDSTDTASSTLGTSSRWSMTGLSMKAFAPTIGTVTPGSAAPGTTQDIIITGTNFMTGATVGLSGGGITVNSATVTSATSITANVTVDAAAALGLRSLTVTNPNSQGSASATVFSVISANAPSIATVTPAALGQGASNVTLAVVGTNFDATSTVSCNNAGVTLTTTYVDATHLTVTASVTGTATTGASNLTVTNSSDGSSSTKVGALTINARPTVTVAAPVTGTLGWTGNVTVTGTGFVNGAVAYFNDAGVTVNSTSFVSATSLTANLTIAANATLGGRVVRVTNPDSGVNSSAASIFTVVDPALTPTLNATPTIGLGQGASNRTITVTGTNFVSGSTVSFSSASITGTVVTTYVSPTQLNVLVPAVSTSASGTSNVTVTNPDTQSATATGLITFGSRPGSTITPTPAIGSTGQTLNVSIAGSNFQNGAAATFSNAGITVNSTSYVSATALTANITVAAAASGTSSITITNPDGGTRTSGSSVFTVTPVGVTSVSPGVGVGGTRDVTITGQGFASGASVAITGGVVVNSVTVVNATTLTANVTVSAVATAGSYDVTVTVGANSGSKAGAFTITTPPAITSISPASLRQGDSGVAVTITGSNFYGTSTLQLNGTGVTLNSASYVSPTQITANVSAAADAPLTSHSFTVVNPDGGIATGGALSVLLTGKTIPGAVSFKNVTKDSITLVVTYAGDGDGDGSCAVSYGTTTGYEAGTVSATRTSGAYSVTFTNLVGGSAGSGNLYYFKVSFSDPDGVNGASVIAATQPTKASPLMHNSQNTFSTKWDQGWGIQGGKYGAFSCSTCHNSSTANIKMVNGTIQSPSMENWSSSGTNTLTVGYLNPATDLGSDQAHATSGNVCEACHSRTDHHRFNNPGANHNGTTDCTPCHDHNEGFLPSCQGCHATPQGPNGYRRQVVGNGGDFYTNMSTHGKFTSLSSKTCTACHYSATHQIFNDGVSVALKNADTGAAILYDGTSATAAATATACISCHDADGSTILGDSATAPFGSSEDFRTPTNISQYWPATGGAHATNMYCFNCHGNSKGVDGSTTNPKYNGHGSGNKHVLQDKAYDVTNPNSYCFNCHNAASTDPNKSSKDISAQLSLSFKHTTAKCFDCHGDENNSLDSLHSLKAGSQTAGSGLIANNISNATGRNLTWGANWGGASASAGIASNSATAEYQVCFKCHAAIGTGTTPDSPSGSAAASLSNLALEFNPNNASGHPIVTGLNNYPNSLAPKALTAAKMKAPWNVNLGTQVMACSDCHATDSAASKGPHGSSVKWMLAGTNKAWPYTLASANGTSSGTYFKLSTYATGNGTKDGLFCLNCHVVTSSNSFHSASGLISSGGEHYNNASVPACVNCHIRVPHGGKISRLLNTANSPSRYKSNGNGTNAVTINTITGKGASPSGNFKCSSTTEHSGGTEAW